MKISIFGAALCLLLNIGAGALGTLLDEHKVLQEIYENATAWTWAHNQKTVGRVKRQANCFTRWMDFSDGKSNSGWDLQTTEKNQHPASEGWTMHSKPGSGDLN